MINNILECKNTNHTQIFFSIALSLSLHLSQYGQSGGKESIITPETRASRMNLRSVFKSMRMRKKAMQKITKTTEFSGHLTSDNKKPARMESDSCHDTKAPNNNPPAVKRGLHVHVREREEKARKSFESGLRLHCDPTPSSCLNSASFGRPRTPFCSFWQ